MIPHKDFLKFGFQRQIHKFNTVLVIIVIQDQISQFFFFLHIAQQIKKKYRSHNGKNMYFSELK